MFLSILNPLYFIEELGEDGKNLLERYLPHIPQETILAQLSESVRETLKDEFLLSPDAYLKRRREEIRGLEERITYRLGNGLAAVAPEACDTIVIAGMGGENIAQILAGAPWTADGRHTLLLQPQSRAEALRRFLAEHGYAIAREALVRDRGFLYPVIEAGAGEMHLTLGQQWAGADLLHDPLGDRYIIEKIIQLQAAAAGSNRASAPEARARGDYARAVITEFLQMREEWRHANCPGN